MKDKLLSNYINHLNKVQRNDIHFQDVSHLLIFMRLILEKEDLKKNYPNISFFSNWYLHPKLDTNPFAKSRLNQISQLMESKFSQVDEKLIFDNDDDFYIQMCEIIGINDLRTEILNFCNEFSVSNNFKDSEYSNSFLRLYLTGICDRPLIFQKKPSELRYNVLIEGFKFIEVENKIYFEIITNLIQSPFIFKFISKTINNEK
jgi:hypothetical protein